MSGLVLKLAPRERVLINGAVIENGERRGKLTVTTPNANILRLRDAIRPEDATTPVRRACYTAQLVLSGDCAPEQTRAQLLQQIEALSQALTDPDSCLHLARATASMLNARYYQCLKALRALIPREDRLLARGRCDGV